MTRQDVPLGLRLYNLNAEKAQTYPSCSSARALRLLALRCMRTSITVGAANMGLLNNGYRHSMNGRMFGATALDGGNPSVLRFGTNPAAKRNMFAGEAIESDVASVPDGCRHPVAWIMPRKPGAMSSRNEITGEGTMTGNAWSVKLAEAMLTGSGELTAFGGLVVQLIASISGSGTVSSADLKAFLQALASIGGSGNATGTMTAFGELIAELLGEGTADGSVLTGIGELEAVIRGYGDLTPEGLRDAVWNAVASNYNATGTMGQKLNSAASGGVDYNALAAAVHQYTIESGFSFEELVRIMAASLAGQVSGAETANITFKGIDGTTDRITATTDTNGNRLSVTLDGN